ncbi:MAG: hypothetical protein VKJ64_06295 [Leptolyngbyaceae bacterium]|nr:hypothetical protein [Leptolyngbyaceae bacterium]
MSYFVMCATLDGFTRRAGIEITVTALAVKSGKKGLFFACIALAGSNAFDTSFLGIASIIRPFALEPSFDNILPGMVTMALTAILLVFVHQHRVPRIVEYVIVPIYLASFALLAII